MPGTETSPNSGELSLDACSIVVLDMLISSASGESASCEDGDSVNLLNSLTSPNSGDGIVCRRDCRSGEALPSESRLVVRFVTKGRVC